MTFDPLPFTRAGLYSMLMALYPLTRDGFVRLFHDFMAGINHLLSVGYTPPVQWEAVLVGCPSYSPSSVLGNAMKDMFEGDMLLSRVMSIAHRAALRNGLYTVGVMPTAISKLFHIYYCLCVNLHGAVRSP